ADDDDHEIGRQIVRAVRGEIEPAYPAIVVDLQERAKQLSLAAARTAAAKAALERSPHVALFDEARLARPDFGGRGHRFHDLLRLALPDFFFSGLRPFSRAPRSKRSFLLPPRGMT